MFIDFRHLEKHGFEVRHEEGIGVEIRPINPKPIEAISILREEVGLSDMQVEEIIITVHEFQVWNAITHK